MNCERKSSLKHRRKRKTKKRDRQGAHLKDFPNVVVVCDRALIVQDQNQPNFWEKNSNNETLLLG